jgi:hypothetical protein
MTKYGEYDLNYNHIEDTPMTSFPRMRLGKLDAAFFALYLSDRMQDEYGVEGSKALIQRQIDRLNTQKGCQM